MSCKQTRAKFDERLDGRLSELEQRAFDQHLASCDSCRLEWQSFAAAWKALQQHQGIEPSFGFVDRTLRRLTDPLVEPRRVWRPALRWAALTAAVIVLSGGIWVGHERLLAQRRVEVYAGIRQADYLEDFDVIASLDQLTEKGTENNGGNQL